MSGRFGDNGGVTEQPDPEDAAAGWFSYEPGGSTEDGDEDPLIRVVQLRTHEYAGPFWDDDGHLSDDFAELQRWLGISRPLFDDAMAWNKAFASSSPAERDAEWRAHHLSMRADLLRRLRREVHPHIVVDGSA